MDINSYRLDAWISSLANRRIEEMRNHQTENEDYSKGIYFGAYGWVENLKKNTDPDQAVVFQGTEMTESPGYSITIPFKITIMTSSCS